MSSRFSRRLALAALALITLVSTAGTASGGQTEAEAPESPRLPTGLHVNRRGALEGYTLYSPLTQATTYLVDMEGNVVHQWELESQPGLYQYLQDDGSIIRAGRIRLDTVFDAANGWGGIIERISWDGEVMWRFQYASDEHLQHHDIDVMPNGNVLILAWEYRSEEEALAAGRDPKLLPDGQVWPDTVVELDPDTQQIVWEWTVWDHLVQDFDETKENFGDPAKSPHKVDVNYSPNEPLQVPGEADWNHANSVDYNAELDQIVISLRSFNEIWIIDHGTTTEEAAGPAGDLLFRFGNPRTHRQGNKSEQKLFAQHDAEWIEEGFPGEGRILVFSNGVVDQREYSSVEEIIPEMDGGEYVLEAGEFAAEMRRVYPKKRADRFFAAIISGSQRLPNGNTLITYGTHGLIVEVTPEGRVVWEYEVPYFTTRPDTPLGNPNFELRPWRTFRAERYPADHPAFEGRDLSPPEDAAG